MYTHLAGMRRTASVLLRMYYVKWAARFTVKKLEMHGLGRRAKLSAAGGSRGPGRMMMGHGQES